MNPRRGQDVSESSAFSMRLSEAAERADQLIDLLDSQMAEGNSATERLARNLSVRSVVSTSSSLAQLQQEAARLPELQKFRQIGAGYCGVVYSHDGTGTIIKIARPNITTLWNDYCLHSLVFDELHQAAGLFASGQHKPPRVPKPEYFASGEDPQWWEIHASKFPPDHMPSSPPQHVLCAERIFPLPRAIREDLIDTFCQEQGRELAKQTAGNKDCIARLYLGRRRSKDITSERSRFFSLRNFSLHLDMAEMIALDIEALAAEMAIGLALCHWRAKVDANDVEFVLGSAPTMLNFATPTPAQLRALPPNSTTFAPTRYANFETRQTHLWMLDFDKCREMPMTEDGITQAVRAAEDNDPYFPKPGQSQPEDQALWHLFAKAYMDASDRIMDADQITGDMRTWPARFVTEWEEYRKQKVEKAKDDRD